MEDSNINAIIEEINKEENNERIEKIYQKEKEKLSNKEVIIKTYYKGKLLGKGGFGQCFEFEDKDNHLIYAGKIVDKDILTGDKKQENIREEIRIQRTFNSPKILKVNNYFEDSENIYIVTELCKNGTLSDLMKKRKYLTEIEVQCYIFQLIQGLKCIHDDKIIHRDLKPGNLFLDDKLELKIGDFGLATKLIKDNEKKLIVVGHYLLWLLKYLIKMVIHLR